MLHRNVVQAKGACAFLAIEMSMAGSMVVRVVMGAKFVVECAFSVFEGMDNVVFEKECQHAEEFDLGEKTYNFTYRYGSAPAGAPRTFRIPALKALVE
jgi:hypothetical protein